MKTEAGFRRREFVKHSAQAAGLAMLPAASHGEPAAAIPVRTLGKTGLKVPILAYGGAALPTAWGNPLSREERVALVRYAYDRGLRYFDTAPGYFDSPSILGEALQDRRSHLYLATKVDTTRPAEVAKSVESSLQALRTDYFDILLIHGTPGLQQMSVEQAMKIHAELRKLRDQRITRFIGFSAHGYFDKALALIDSGGFDLCMLSHGYIPRGYDQFWGPRMIELRNACVARAHAFGMGIVAMKVMGAGMLGAWSGRLVPDFDKQRLGRLSGAAIRYVLDDPRVHLLNIGMRLRGEIDANLNVLAGDLACTADDRSLLADFTARLYQTDAIKKLRIEA